MNNLKSLFAFLFLLVATLFTASDAQAFAPGNHAVGFFLGTLDCAGSENPGTRNPCRENGWLNYDTLSGYVVAAERVVANPAGKLTYDAAAKTWTSPGGLVYGQGSAHGNRVLHVMDHTVANASKPVHSVFSAPRNQVIGLVDEAWAARSGAGTLQANGNRVWTVDMGRQVGTGGQTSVQIVVRDGTTEIITAFPK